MLKKKNTNTHEYTRIRKNIIYDNSWIFMIIRVERTSRWPSSSTSSSVPRSSREPTSTSTATVCTRTRSKVVRAILPPSMSSRVSTRLRVLPTRWLLPPRTTTEPSSATTSPRSSPTRLTSSSCASCRWVTPSRRRCCPRSISRV